MGILRTIIVLSGLTAFIPAPPENSAQASASSFAEGANYLTAATGTFADLAGFCNRQPGVCRTAGFVVAKLERKAKYGVRMIYEWAHEAKTTEPDVVQGDPIKTGSLRLVSAENQRTVSQTTLTIEDLIPEWLGPKAATNG